MDVILSIKPKHVDAIKIGKKHYEFRKVIFRKSVGRVYIYATSPIKKITGYFKVGEIIEDQPNNLWKALHKYAGISQSEFFSYYGTSSKGFAIEIKDVIFFEFPINPYEVETNFFPPQSLKYIDFDLYDLTYTVGTK